MNLLYASFVVTIHTHQAKQLLNDEKQRLATVELNLAAELVDFETKRTEEFKVTICI